jgi:hypothetical protein
MTRAAQDEHADAMCIDASIARPVGTALRFSTTRGAGRTTIAVPSAVWRVLRPGLHRCRATVVSEGDSREVRWSFARLQD